MLKFTKEHEWVRVDGDIVTIGITDYAQQQLGDVVFVELPEIGRVLEQGKEAAVVESAKAASEIYAPVGGTVTKVNTTLADAPGSVNADPLGDGWFFEARLTAIGQLGDLMDETAYAAFVAELG